MPIRDLNDLKRQLRTLPNIARNITDYIDIEELQKRLDRNSERELRRRISR